MYKVVNADYFKEICISGTSYGVGISIVFYEGLLYLLIFDWLISLRCYFKLDASSTSPAILSTAADDVLQEKTSGEGNFSVEELGVGDKVHKLRNLFDI